MENRIHRETKNRQNRISINCIEIFSVNLTEAKITILHVKKNKFQQFKIFVTWIHKVGDQFQIDSTTHKCLYKLSLFSLHVFVASHKYVNVYNLSLTYWAWSRRNYVSELADRIKIVFSGTETKNFQAELKIVFSSIELEQNVYKLKCLLNSLIFSTNY